YEKDQIDYQLSFAEFFTWMIEAIQKVISDLQAGSYNEDVKQNLSLWERTGVIRRKDFWDIFPEDRGDYFSDITIEEVKEFTELISDQEGDSPVGAYISSMTSGKFYEFCRLGYAANNYEMANGLSAKDLYYKYADGRDEDLSKLDENSPVEFEN
ncbi:MAG: hypothetical protein LUH07_08030, partial [Lachnospiraceae bacterium]|nr:hypothetical protein [Lachnospiraceae bacterium]